VPHCASCRVVTAYMAVAGAAASVSCYRSSAQLVLLSTQLQRSPRETRPAAHTKAKLALSSVRALPASLNDSLLAFAAHLLPWFPVLCSCNLSARSVLPRASLEDTNTQQSDEGCDKLMCHVGLDVQSFWLCDKRCAKSSCKLARFVL
jgi:hypothetical protein